MDIYHVIKRPLVTEKGTHQAQQSHPATKHMPARGGAYAFEVHPDATKPMIKEAIEKIYKVRVQSVRTANRRGKRRRVRFKTGKTADWKKAVVVLHAEDHIDLF
ncbi:MAG: 50S ribosomal protein L23 [Planctomycetota bacterium]|nr:MAG: 50S ribosomal protein L23 [Planctomycetota bacterium]